MQYRKVVDDPGHPTLLFFYSVLIQEHSKLVFKIMIKLNIGGRLIIPIRAIPEVTGRDIPPDDIAKILAGTAHRWQPKVSLASYHYELDGSFNPIFQRDWDGVVGIL